MTQAQCPEVDNLLAMVQGWCGREWDCTCGERHVIPTRHVFVESGAHRRLDWTLRQVVDVGQLLWVADEQTQRAAGEAPIAALRAGGWQVREIVLGADCHAEEGTMRRVLDGCTGVSAAVAVGAGTVNDLTKLAATEAGIPYVSFATAPSMNGFTSRIGAVLVDGVKQTLPATPPFAVVGDVDILSAAPRDMIAAGLADLQSKGCATSDWRIASRLHGEYFCSLPFEMLQDAEAMCVQVAERIGRAEPEAVAVLTASLVLSGFAMVVAGSSAPASGGEHLLSHFWEMTRFAQGKPTLLHGLQVGLGTLIASTLYQRLRQWDPREFSLRQAGECYPTWDDERQQIEAVYGDLAGAVLEHYAQKYQPWESKREHVADLLTQWDELWDEVAPLLPDPGRIRSALLAAGAPTTAEGLGLSRDEVVSAVRWARCLRARYTVLDLAWDLRLLDDWAEPVLTESGVA